MNFTAFITFVSESFRFTVMYISDMPTLRAVRVEGLRAISAF